MKIKCRKRTNQRQISRMNKKQRIRKTIKGTEERPRLCVYRSLNHMYAQIINDIDGRTIVSASSSNLEKTSGKKLSLAVGKEIAKKAIEKNIKNVVFDRNGYVFHGRVKALADGAREAGLNF